MVSERLALSRCGISHRQGSIQLVPISSAKRPNVLPVSSHNHAYTSRTLTDRSSVANVLFWANFAVMVSPAIKYHWLHYELTGLYLGFTNMMACRVFRGVALGQMEDNATQVGMSTTAVDAALRMDLLPMC